MKKLNEYTWISPLSACWKIYLFVPFIIINLQAGYFTLLQKNSEVNKLGTLQMLHLNAWNTLPVFTVLSVALGEALPASNQLLQSSYVFIFLFTLLLLSGGILMFSTFLCNSLCSALTTSLVGVAKAIFQTVIGYFTFGGVPYHPLNVAGIVFVCHISRLIM